jgi:hypothetical protein
MEQGGNFGWDWFGLVVSQSNVLDDGINECALRKRVGSVFGLLNVATDIVSWVTLVFNIEASILNVMDGLPELFIVESKEDAIINVHHENDVVLVEDTIINQQCLVSKGGELGDQELIPHATNLLLTIDILQELEDIVLGISLSNLHSLGKLHVHVTLNWGLRIGHDEDTLTEGPAAENANDNQQAYGEPSDNRCKSLVIIHSVFLLSTMKVESSFVLLDLIGGDVLLAAQRPYRWQHVDIRRYFRSLGELSLLVVDVTIYFSDDGFYKV